MPSATQARIIAIAVLLPVALGAARAWNAKGLTESRLVPPPAKDEVAGTRTSAVAVFAGGCFWGVQGVYQHVRGVLGAVSGYAGGDRSTAEYERVGTGQTGHAESVQITYDPRMITYGKLLQIFFSVAHDPTELNRQGPDDGPQYRSAIFPLDAEQASIATAYVAQLNRARAYDAAIVTTIELDRQFFPAEAYHQDFMERNPRYPYIVINDAPKVADLQRLFGPIYRSSPVLVNAAK
jgi:peptide-methionine (S)-S-oxide reductase